jgi:dihydroorotate dehydrogenase electron transfer subunit
MGVDDGHRHEIFAEEAEILRHRALPGAQHLLTLAAPQVAARAEPGQFVQVRCDPALPLRRPLSLLRADAGRGTVEILYKVVGEGTRLLAAKQPGMHLPLLGPIGVPFPWATTRRRPLLLGGGVGMPPILFLAERLAKLRKSEVSPLVLLGSEVPFPFSARPSQMLLPALPPAVIAAVPLLEDLGVASRLASLRGYPGCFEGYVPDLARMWCAAHGDRGEISIYACGPGPMLQAVAALCAEFQIPGWLSLEEHMACGVGGCAGCTVDLERGGERVRKRVCVDGPVFAAHEVVFS